MSISKVSGRMLQDNLVRDSNLAIDTDTVYVDITNSRLGVNTSTTTHTLTVNGDTNISGNTSVGNLNTTIISATGNVTGGNISTAGIVTATGNVSGGNLSTIGSLSSTGNANVGNLGTAGLITATGNITGGNLVTANLVSGGNVAVESATANRIFYSDANKQLRTDANLTFNGSVLQLTGTANIGNFSISASNINSSSTINFATSSNGNINLTPQGSGLVVINSTTGLVLPVGNTAQQPSPAVTGTIRYNSAVPGVEVYNGTAWTDVSAPITAQVITPDGSSTVYILDKSVSQQAVLIITNGVVQLPGTAYTVAGNAITFAEAPQTTDIIDVRFLQ
jgi:hypothetical protein